MLRAVFANYFYLDTGARVMIHDNNYRLLAARDKIFTVFIVTGTGHLRINWKGNRDFYVGDHSNLHLRFNCNFLSKCCKPMGAVPKSYFENIEKQLGRIPFKTFYKYRMISTFNRSDYWFDENAYAISHNYALSRKIVTKKDNFIQSTGFFTELEHTKNLTDANIKTIKEFNNHDKESKEAELYEIVNPSEHAFFLYDSQNLIRETFVSEINKQIHLIGSVSFFDKIQKDGKMQLVKTSDKLKYDVKKKCRNHLF